MGPLISVIVPVYKVENYLDRCVESIAKQSYENLEIILVDDGSPDRCGQLCDEWAARDLRVKVIHKKNGGLSDARNTGISNAHGEYIAFVDSDDYIAFEMIERLYNAARLTGANMSLCRVYCVDEYNNPTGEADSFTPPPKCFSAEEILPRFYQPAGQFYIVAWNKLYHRSIVNNQTFPVGKWHEDEFTAAQLIWSAKRIACIDYVGYYYVTKRTGSIMSAYQDIRHLDALEALIIRYHFYQQIGQTHLLHETRARVLKALEEYYWRTASSNSVYGAKMAQLRREYDRLTGLPPKEWLKWKTFQISPKLERLLISLK